ncbi:MAG: peptidylprolyl isomerase [Flavobacteriales bacterium]|nr:peptidylprolyl isomerase [Flavobacteriales bacterium]
MATSQEEIPAPEAAVAAIDSVQETGPKVLITTDMGDITVMLYDSAPEHRDNFIKLANEGFYDGLLFHRVMQNFMIQGGDPDSKDAKPGQRLGQNGPGYTLDADFKDRHIHIKGMLAAARQPDQVNPKKKSSGSQFYIVQGRPVTESMLLNMQNQRNAKFGTEFEYAQWQINQYVEKGGAPWLDGDYTIFGEVLEGMDVVDAIAAVAVDGAKRPREDVKMTIKVIEE